ncbi:hypothetical protein NVS55_40120 (plasmid) [Myxococcus stipitatus]|uniref:hypothetical protein n=1 Tax=Myxococcus stipitatus TaxID=83455 RepID=UPI00314555C0
MTLLRTALTLLFALSILLTNSCDRPTLLAPTEDQGTVAGRVSLGRTSSQAITVFRLVDGQKGAEVGSALADENGLFRVAVGLATTGPFLVTATGGTSVDPATGATLQHGRDELTAIVPSFPASSSVAGLVISPVSHLTTAATLYRSKALGEELSAAYYAAAQHLHGHFGGLDWTRVVPTDLSATASPTLDDPTKAGLVIGALSMEARTISETAGVTPGSLVTGYSLTRALHDDLLADGLFDGRGTAGQLTLPPGLPVPPAYSLDANTARLHLAQALARYLTSEKALPGSLRTTDIQPLAAAIAQNSDPFLFSSAGANVDITPPEVTWVTPLPGAGVAGIIPLELRASDGSGLKAFRLTAPGQLADLVATIDGRTGSLVGKLDVSIFPDGPLELVAYAEDVAGNVVTPRNALTVANRGPSVSVSSPSDGATLSGVVVLSATAAPQQGVIRRLFLKDPPPGVTPDTLPAADAFAATWNTALAPEGPTTLVFRAEDTVGGATDFPVRIHVDNVPFGTVNATVSAGSPIAGATVQLVAIDATTGLPASRPGGAVLGHGGPTDAKGTVTFTLTGENWDGPVRLEASGTGLSFVDPTDGTATVAVPGNALLTSLLPRYKTGDSLTAPITLYTTLADSAALAFARGTNPTHPPSTLPSALAAVDRLFESHVSGTTAWDIRRVVPVSLTEPPQQTLRDVVFASLPDLGINAHARRIAISTGLTPVSGFDALKLLSLLQRDISDGRFDGREGTVPLRVLGSPTYSLTADELRVRLALGLDDFITSQFNRSGLTRGDLRVAEPNVYDQLSLDTSALFDPGTEPTPFDTTPPVVSVSVSFTGDDGALRGAPVGPALRVANTLSIEVSAHDPENSGIRLLTVSLGGRPLTDADPSSSRVAGTFVPPSEGALELVAIAEDSLGNRTVERRSLTVDNTPPALVVTSPAADAYYGTGPLSLSATAEDAGGIAVHTVGGLTGASTAGLSSLTGSWTPPPGTLDGAVTAAWSACDTVGNCRHLSVPFRLDRAAPLIDWKVRPPDYTNADSYTFHLTATDSGSGVSSVLARRSTHPGEALPATRQPDGTWKVSVPLSQSDGPTTVLLWAHDAALPPNSGTTHPGTDALRTIIIKRDTIAPSVTFFAGRYRSEDGIGHRESAPGVPIVPVQYSVTGVNSPIRENSQIFKATTRLNPGPLTYAELTTDNATNTPWIGFEAPVAPTEAAITTARFTISCTGCAEEVSAGDIALSTSENGFQRFALPLTAATIPGLATATAPSLALRVSTSFTDAAGNTTSHPDVFLTFNLASPWVSFTHEAGYASSRDLKSVHAYRVALGTYDELWAESPAFEGAQVMRIARYIIRNPHNVPIAVTFLPNPGNSWTLTEHWLAALTADPNTANVNRDGHTFTASINYDFGGGYALCEGIPKPPTYPCAYDEMGPTVTSTHEFGNSAQWQCEAPSTPSPTPFTSTTWDTVGYRPWPGAGEPEAQRAPASFQISGRAAWVVPAASGNSPGELALYMVLPRNRGTLPVFTGTSEYEYLYGYAYTGMKMVGQCRDDNGETLLLHRLYRHLMTRRMTSASLSLTWVSSLGARATHANGAPHGAPRSGGFESLSTTIDLTRN